MSYDDWKLAHPPEYDEAAPLDCEACGWCHVGDGPCRKCCFEYSRKQRQPEAAE